MRVLAFAIVFAAATAFADKMPEPREGCFPACRAGFNCSGGTCVADPNAPTTPTAPTPPSSPSAPAGGVLWGPESNAPGTGTQVLSADARPAPAPPKTPPRLEVSVGFAFDALFFSSKKYEDGTPEAMEIPNGRHLDHLDMSSPVEFRIREGNRPMLFSVRVGWSLVHIVEKSDSPTLRGDSNAGVIVAAQQVFRIPLSRESAPLLDRTLSIDLGIGGFFASQGTVGGMANATINVYWLGVGPQFAFGTETGFDVGLRFVTNFAF